MGRDSCNFGGLTSGARDSWSNTGSWDCSEYRTAAWEVVAAVETLEWRIEESWIHQSSSARCRKWQTGLKLEREVEAVVDSWNAYKGLVESILLPLGLASMIDDLYCRVSVDPYSHC